VRAKVASFSIYALLAGGCGSSQTEYCPTCDDAGVADAGSDARPDAPRLDGPPPSISCATQWPPATTTAVGFVSERLYLRLRAAGVTPSGGNDPALQVEVGDNTAGGAWSWFPAVHNPSCLNCADEDEWMGSVTPASVGEAVWGARARYADGPFTTCTGSPGLTAAPPGALRVVTLNLRCLVDDWDARLPVAAAGLAAEDADAYGLQEACAGGGRDNLEELVAELSSRTGRTYQIVRTVTHRSWSDSYDEGIAVITPHRIAESQIVDLPAGTFLRKLILTRIIGPQGPMVVATTHLDHQDGETRAAQAAALAGAAQTFALSGEGMIVMGDMNEGPGAGVEEALSGSGLVDLGVATGPTFPASGPTSRIDQVWLRSSASGFAPQAAARILTSAVGGVLASDHVGVSARVIR
jgi:endonuclease/exonuclease/phosphatase family metal-dependent hydrolase